MDWTPEQIDALGKHLVAIVTAAIAAFSAAVTGVLAFLQSRCRRELRQARYELDVAHAMNRSRDSGRPWQEEMRSAPRNKERHHVLETGPGHVRKETGAGGGDPASERGGGEDGNEAG